MSDNLIKRGKGRPKGSPNKTTALLKDAILQAATEAGEAEGLVGYLRIQAMENPGPFLSLLGKVLPLQVNASIQHSNATNLSDDELARIATGGGIGIAEETEGPQLLN